MDRLSPRYAACGTINEIAISIGPSSIRARSCDREADEGAGANPDTHEIEEPRQGRTERRRRASVDQADAELERQQPRRVVDQALALEQVDEPLRQPDLSSDRRGGDGVGGCDHRAEDHADPPVEAGEQPRSRERDRHGRSPRVRRRPRRC